MKILEFAYLFTLAVLVAMFWISSRRSNREWKKWKKKEHKFLTDVLKLEHILILYEIKPDMVMEQIEELLKEAKEALNEKE